MPASVAFAANENSKNDYKDAVKCASMFGLSSEFEDGDKLRAVYGKMATLWLSFSGSLTEKSDDLIQSDYSTQYKFIYSKFVDSTETKEAKSERDQLLIEISENCFRIEEENQKVMMELMEQIVGKSPDE